MTVEWLLIGILLVAAMVMVVHKSRSFGAWLVAGLVLAVSAGTAFGLQKKLSAKKKSQKELLAQIPTQDRPSYVRAETCKSCHPQQYESWHRSYHRTMTQVVSPEAVRGDFNNVTLEFAGRKYHLERRGDEFWVDMVDPDWARTRALQEQMYATGERKDPPPPAPNPPRVQKRITMLTGSHHMQAYWVSSKHTNTQLSIPFTYLFADQRWAPRPDVFLRDPKMNPEPQYQMWNNNCLKCHSTAGQPQLFTNRLGSATQVGEFGISCEACHGPAEEHVKKNRDPRRRYELHKDGKGDSTIVHPGKLSHVKSSETCGQCHSLSRSHDNDEWLRCGFTYKPGEDLEKDRTIIRMTQLATDKRIPDMVRKDPTILHGFFWPDGMVRVSGREFTGMVEAPCYQRGEMSCLSCHSMHKSDPDDQLAARMDGNQACLQCHKSIANKIEEHTHHKLNSSGSSCYNCHMPHTTFGLLKAIRSHTVSSPNVTAQLDTGRPNACNLCHLDKTLAWTATNLASWYKIPAPRVAADDEKFSSAALMTLRGDAGQRALIAWHMGWKPAQEISGNEWSAKYLAQLLEDPYSAVRYISLRSLRTLPNHLNFAFDYLSPPLEQSRAHERALKGMNPVAILPKTVDLPEADYKRVLRERNDREMELLE